VSFSLKRYQSLSAYSFYHAARQAPVSVSFDEIHVSFEYLEPDSGGIAIQY